MIYFKKTKKTGKSKKPKTMEQSFDDKFWKVFSEYTRLRDSDENGICKCPTCGRFGYYRSMDAGHFISRGKFNTKYDERNVWAQCRNCNRFGSGRQYKFSLAIDKKYGLGMAEKIQQLSEIPVKKSLFPFEEKMKYYKEKIKELRSQKNLED